MTLYFFNTLKSTNLHLKHNFNNYNNFDVIIAEHQTDGYGRFNRKWIDLGNDNIYMSICLKSNFINDNLISISQYSAFILAKTFEEFYVKPEIKWPNDVMISSKKIAGILAEVVSSNSKIDGIVLGLGINLHAQNNDFSSVTQNATALDIELGKQIKKEDFINIFMKKFVANYDNLIKFGFGYFKEEYSSYLIALGESITINNNDFIISGVIKGVNDKGMLILDVNNKIKEISAGDISFI